ncbi:MAG TPA: hypothetical protein DIT66_02940, partial [Rhodobiaceae bacterium]|nr:hypothetical protein [Rhodobiaceae bacterium]
ADLDAEADPDVYALPEVEDQAEMKEKVEAAPDTHAEPDLLDTSHPLATAIAETATAFDEIDVALAAEIAEEQANDGFDESNKGENFEGDDGNAEETY